MSTAVSIRRWAESDWETLRDIRLEGLRGHSDVFLRNAEEEREKDQSYWIDMLNDPSKSAIFGLYDGDEVIGLTGAFRWKESEEDTVILGMSYIRPSYRGRGLSELLYKARLDWAWAQKGITRILVSHKEGNDASRVANQKWGFRFYATDTIRYGDGSMATNYKYELKRDKNE